MSYYQLLSNLQQTEEAIELLLLISLPTHPPQSLLTCVVTFCVFPAGTHSNYSSALAHLTPRIPIPCSYLSLCLAPQTIPLSAVLNLQAVSPWPTLPFKFYFKFSECGLLLPQEYLDVYHYLFSIPQFASLDTLPPGLLTKHTFGPSPYDFLLCCFKFYFHQPPCWFMPLSTFLPSSVFASPWPPTTSGFTLMWLHSSSGIIIVQCHSPMLRFNFATAFQLLRLLLEPDTITLPTFCKPF